MGGMGGVFGYIIDYFSGPETLQTSSAAAARMAARDPLIDPTQAAIDPIEEERLADARRREGVRKRLGDTLERLRESESQLVVKHETCDRQIRHLMKTGKKESAIGLIRKRNLYKRHLEDNRNKQLTTETQLLHLEQVDITHETVSAVKDAHVYLQDSQKKGDTLGAGDMQDIMTDVMVAQEEHQVMSEVMSAGAECTEEDAEEEYDRLAEEMASAAKPNATDTRKLELPKVPDDEIDCAPESSKLKATSAVALANDLFD